jgi:hypothetical protein
MIPAQVMIDTHKAGEHVNTTGPVPLVVEILIELGYFEPAVTFQSALQWKRASRGGARA